MKSLLPSIPEKNRSTREAPHYKARHAFYMAFFSSQLYLDVIRRWRGLGMFYFFIMLSVMTLPHSVQLMCSLNKVIETKILLPIKSLPPISIRSGEVIFHGAMPYLIKNNDGEVMSIIDTEGHINQLPAPLYPLASILITKHNIHVDFRLLDLLHVEKAKQPERKDVIIGLKSIKHEDFLAASWLDNYHVTTMKNLLLVVIYPMVVMLNASLFITILLSMVLFAQLTARMLFKVRLTFFESSRLLFVATTPLVALCSALVLFQWVIPGKDLVYIALLTAYFCFGVLAYRRSNKSNKMIAI